MMNLDIFQSSTFQSLFLKHFVFDGGRFVQDESSSKEEFCYNCEDLASLKHDQLIRDSCAFFECDQGLFILFDGVIFYCNSEADIIPLGDNPLNFTLRLAEDDNIFDVHKVIDFDGFVKALGCAFGEFSHDSDSGRINRLVQEYMLD